MKKIYERLLSVLLVLVMVSGLVPMSGATEVKAASTKTVYFDSSNTGWSNVNICAWDKDNGEVALFKAMTEESKNIYKYELSEEAIKIVFTKKNSWADEAKSQTVDLEVSSNQWANHIFKIEGTSGVGNLEKYTGSWSIYTTDDSQTTLGDLRYVKATFYDYLSDDEINANAWNSFNEEDNGSSARKKWYPFWDLNKSIAMLAKDYGWNYAMYFGNFYMNNATKENIKSFTDIGVNESLGNEYFDTQINNSNTLGGTNRVVTGLVQNKLVNGNLMVKDGLVAPFFDEEFLTDVKKNNQGKVLAKVIETEFPLVTRTTADLGQTLSAGTLSGNNIYYSFDSTNGQDNVRFDSDNKTLIYGSGTSHAVYDSKSNFSTPAEANGIGFFPFDKNKSDGGTTANNANNFGFGVKYEIDFTLPAGGQKNNEDVIFSFSGDDDLWVFVDDVLVLDMGGDHAKASGEINFKELKSYLAEEPVQKGDGSKNTVTDFPQLFGDGDDTFDNSNTSQIHHMTIFYMERGLIESNLKIGFSFDPLPTGLSVSKEVDVTNVNSGLQEAVKTMDTFDFNMQTSNDENGTYDNVKGVSYTKNWDGEKKESATVTDGNIKGLADNIYAHDFVKTNGGGNAFSSGTWFKIEETNVDTSKYTTTWKVYDLAGTGTPKNSGVNTSAEFQFGDDLKEGELKSVNYNVNFINTPILSDVSLTKKWSGVAAPSSKFDFEVLVDLAGDNEEYEAYKLAYTTDNGTPNDPSDDRPETLSETGTLQLAANETVTFSNIPVGARVKAKETITYGTDWMVDGDSEKSVLVEADKTNNITIKNKAVTVVADKVIYVEAGTNTTYTGASDKETFKVTSKSDDITVDYYTDETNSEKKDPVFNAKDAGEVYQVKYTGTKDGVNVGGTITVLTYKATDKVYVFDYGLESDIAATNSNNDGLFQDGVFYNDNATGDDATTATLGVIKDKEGSTNPQTSISNMARGSSITEEGKLVDEDENHVAVMFTPDAFMDSVEEYVYQANVVKKDATFDANNPDPETGTVVNGTIKVMPANVVYYEDNFAKEITIEGENATIINNTPITLTQSNNQEELYGYDDSYSSQTGDSAGGSTGLKVGAKATFEFKGTGFDLISRTNKTTGSIVFKVKDTVTNDVKYYGAVDTYYNNGDLYQLPVLSIKGMNYSTYEVTILVVSSANDEDEDNDNDTIFYLDGVRIYDPAGETLDEYYIENEAEAEIKDIRQMILGNCEITESGVIDSSGELITSAEVEGSTASVLSYDDDQSSLYYYGNLNQEQIDAETATYSASLAEFLRRGPANEVYISEDAGVAFVVKADGTPNPTLQVEAKLVNVGTGIDSDELKLSMLNSEKETKEIATISTNTAMYYDVPVSDGIPLGNDCYLVVLVGDSTEEKCISMTNLKTKRYTISSPADSSNNELVNGHITEYEPWFEEDDPYRVDITFEEYESTVQKGKQVKAIVSVPGGSEIDGFQVYGNGNALTTKTEELNTADGKTKYRVTFMMPKASGTFTLKFVAYKLDEDGEKPIESVAYITKTARVR